MYVYLVLFVYILVLKNYIQLLASDMKKAVESLITLICWPDHDRLGVLLYYFATVKN